MLRRKDTVSNMRTFTATRVEILSNRPQPRQLDGDLITAGRQLLVTVRPKALLLCVPQPATDPDLANDAGAVREAVHAPAAGNQSTKG
ncbi:hypothetical protein Acsp02_79350 [Actinoplanes sp. NBRC 103695]|nr:hypothetical protein Acsp02_79350 [Actinoplanes sp. NBRC 103695]